MILMMMRRKLMVMTSLICCSAAWFDARAGMEPTLEPALINELKKTDELKNSFQRVTETVVRPDGLVVDRLADFNAAKDSADDAKRMGAPATPEAWLARMLDPSKNGLVVKHPELLAEWLDAVTEPRFMTALASVAMSPETYANSLGKMVDPATARNWAEFADPRIPLRWMAVGTNPAFYQAVYDRMTDSAKLRRWGAYPAVSGINASRVDGQQAPVVRDMKYSSGGEWLKMPMRELNGNPWLSNTVNYRY